MKAISFGFKLSKTGFKGISNDGEIGLSTRLKTYPLLFII